MRQIDHNEPFAKTLRTVARELIQWPVGYDELVAAWKGVLAIGWLLMCIFIRATLMLLYPVSVFLVAWAARLDSRKSERQLAESKRQMYERFKAGRQVDRSEVREAE